MFENVGIGRKIEKLGIGKLVRLYTADGWSKSLH